MAIFWYDDAKTQKYEYTYEEFIEHLASNHEIIFKLDNKKLAIYQSNDSSYVLRFGNERHSYKSKHSIVLHYIYPGKTLEDLWDQVELVDVF